MSRWRRFALELFPEHRDWIEDGDTIFSIYQLFFRLLPIVQELHANQDHESLINAYQFAEWCWAQKKTSPDLHNAVGVAFYEHLVDDASSLREIQDWIKPEIFQDVKGLFRARLPPEDYRELVQRYNRTRGTNFDEF